MFRFEHPEYLWFLALLPVLTLVFWLLWRQRKRRLRALGESSSIMRMMPHFSKAKQLLKLTLLLGGLAFLIVGWANPQWGQKRQKVQRKAVDIFIAFDVSQSMEAEDIAPSRIERAKRFTEELIRELEGNRIGLIIFAQNAFLQMPLTDDYGVAISILNTLSTDMVTYQGTSIGSAIAMADKFFPEDNQNHKAVILVTDGESHDENAQEEAKKAYDKGILLFTVGVGTEQGAVIPVTINGKRQYKKDRSGQIVRSSLNVDMLREIAEIGRGSFFTLNERGQLLEELSNAINRMEKRELEMRLFEEYESYFQYFLGMGLLILIIDFLISFRQSRWIGRRDIFEDKTQRI